MMITEGMVLKWVSAEGDTLITRVLSINPPLNQAVLFDVDDELALPEIVPLQDVLFSLEQGTVIPIEYNIPFLVLPEEEIPVTYRARRDKAWEAIKPIVTGEAEPLIYDHRFRGQLVKETVLRSGFTKRQIYIYLRNYWRKGKIPNALLPSYHNCGKGERDSRKAKKNGRISLRAQADEHMMGIVITPEIESYFKQAIDLWYHKKDRYPLTKVYDNLIECFFVQGYEEKPNGDREPVLKPMEEQPTLRQFRYWYSKHRDVVKELTSRVGQRRFNLSYRPVLGHSTPTFGPGSVYEIDATIADIYLVHRYNRNWLIGRPVVYIVIDRFSRLITGLYVGLEGPSWIGAMMALENAATDKVSYCASHGIEITPEMWPTAYLPESIVADRGEMLSSKANNLVKSLGVDVINLPPYRPDWKAIVENRFRMINDETISWQPGAIRKRQKERGERDYRLDAIYDIEQFEQLLIHSILRYNNSHAISTYERTSAMIRDEVPPIPLDLWNWGLMRGGKLRAVARDILRLNLLPSDNASVRANGIIFRNRAYKCEKALQDNWFVRSGSRPAVEISFDPRSNEFIYIRLDGGRDYAICHLIDGNSRYREIRDEEARDIDSYEASVLQELRAAELQQKATTHMRQNKILEEAVRSNQEISNGELLKDNIREHRKDQREIIRNEQVWAPQEDIGRGKVIPFPSDKNNEEDVPEVDFTELIQTLTDESGE